MLCAVCCVLVVASCLFVFVCCLMIDVCWLFGVRCLLWCSLFRASRVMFLSSYIVIDCFLLCCLAIAVV